MCLLLLQVILILSVWTDCIHCQQNGALATENEQPSDSVPRALIIATGVAAGADVVLAVVVTALFVLLCAVKHRNRAQAQHETVQLMETRSSDVGEESANVGTRGNEVLYTNENEQSLEDTQMYANDAEIVVSKQEMLTKETEAENSPQEPTYANEAEGEIPIYTNEMEGKVHPPEGIYDNETEGVTTHKPSPQGITDLSYEVVELSEPEGAQQGEFDVTDCAAYGLTIRD